MKLLSTKVVVLSLFFLLGFSQAIFADDKLTREEADKLVELRLHHEKMKRIGGRLDRMKRLSGQERPVLPPKTEKESMEEYRERLIDEALTLISEINISFLTPKEIGEQKLEDSLEAKTAKLEIILKKINDLGLGKIPEPKKPRLKPLREIEKQDKTAEHSDPDDEALIRMIDKMKTSMLKESDENLEKMGALLLESQVEIGKKRMAELRKKLSAAKGNPREEAKIRREIQEEMMIQSSIMRFHIIADKTLKRADSDPEKE